MYYFLEYECMYMYSIHWVRLEKQNFNGVKLNVYDL